MGPPPSPPHSGDCDLGMTYEIKHAFGETEVFDVHFKRWVQTRPITVAFWGQRIDIDNGLTLVLKKNGRVGTRRLGTPPWDILVSDVEARRQAGMDVENI